MVKDDYLVSRPDIQNYARRNTSPKFPLEQKYLQAYTDSMLNSKDVMELYRHLDEITCNGEQFNAFISYWKESGKVNEQTMRAVTAWSMLKKDERLFWLLCWALFTGYIKFYDNPYLESDLAETTDEFPLRYTDEGLYTDMKGILGVKGIFPGFHCVFCSDPISYVGEEWQTLETLWSYLQKAKILITMTKPIRITPFLFYQRFCYVGGDDSHEDLCGIDKSKGYSTPFGWGIGMKYTDENWWHTSKEQSTEYPKSYVDWEPYYDPDDDGVGHWDPPDGADLRYTDDPERRYTDLSGIVNEISKKTPEELISLYPVAHIEGEDLVKDLPWGFKQWRWVRMDPAVKGYEYAPYMLRIIFVLRIWKEQLRNEPDFAKDITQMREDIWPQIAIPSTMQDVPDVIFTPLAQPLQATSDFYFLQLEIRLPISQECTWADDNKWHDWWDWRNLDRPVSPEDVPEWWDDWRKQWEEIPNYNVYGG